MSISTILLVDISWIHQLHKVFSNDEIYYEKIPSYSKPYFMKAFLPAAVKFGS